MGERCKPFEEAFMSNEAKRPERGSIVIDVTPIADFLIDTAPGSLTAVRRAQPGFDAVLREIFENQPVLGAQAGILQSEVDELRLLTHRLALLEQHLPGVRKLFEMMLETEAYMETRCQEIVRNIAKNIDARYATTKDDTLRAKYEATLRYRSAPAKKAAKTRQKKAAAQASEKTS